MFVNVTLKVPMGNQLVIPANGVLQSGTRAIAFVERSDGYIEPREVQLGSRVGDDFIVLKGLKMGEQIVTSANFLMPNGCSVVSPNLRRGGRRTSRLSCSRIEFADVTILLAHFQSLEHDKIVTYAGAQLHLTRLYVTVATLDKAIARVPDWRTPFAGITAGFPSEP